MKQPLLLLYALLGSTQAFAHFWMNAPRIGCLIQFFVFVVIISFYFLRRRHISTLLASFNFVLENRRASLYALVGNVVLACTSTKRRVEHAREYIRSYAHLFTESVVFSELAQ